MDNIRKWIDIVGENYNTTNIKLYESKSLPNCQCKSYSCMVCFPDNTYKSSLLREGVSVKVSNNKVGTVVEVTSSKKFVIVELDDAQCAAYPISQVELLDSDNKNTTDSSGQDIYSPLSFGSDAIDSDFKFYEDALMNDEWIEDVEAEEIGNSDSDCSLNLEIDNVDDVDDVDDVDQDFGSESFLDIDRLRTLSGVYVENKSRKNPVAKNLNKFNKPVSHKDKKKEEKAGLRKHKNDYE